MQLSGGKLWLCSLWVVFVAAMAAPSHAQEANRNFHIRPEPLAEALVSFALQAGISIGDTGISFGAAKSNPVYGAMPPEEALGAMLKDSGYRYVFIDPYTVRIFIDTERKRPASMSPSDAIESVVVTITKRQGIAQDLPYSIVATDGAHLEETGARESDDLSTRMAGLISTNLGPGLNKFLIRGLSDSVLPGLSESMVGLYLDESRITDDAPDPDLRLVDIDRVEVVRGPQGALYGAGSLGGLVRIITKKPDFGAFEFSASASVASTQNGSLSDGFQGVINIPLISGKLALRALGYAQSDAGYIDEIRLGAHNTNRVSTEGSRLTVAWQANDRWSVTTGLTYQEIKAADSQYYEAGLRVLERDNYVREPQSNRILLGNITVDGSLGWADVVSSTGAVWRHLAGHLDASLGWNELTGFPLGPAVFADRRDVLSVTHETRLTSNGTGRWDWLIGVSLSHREEDLATSIIGPDGSDVPLTARSEKRHDNANEAALFGEATYRLSDEFSITAGARGFAASRDVSARVAGITAPENFKFQGSNDQPGITPKFVVSFRPKKSLLFYAQVTQGYRLGGINISSPTGTPTDLSHPQDYDSDSLWNYEIGAKTSFWDGKVVANLAAYFEDWHHVQSDQVRSDGSYFIVNAGTVYDRGVELDVAFEPVERLIIQGNFFWNNAVLHHPNPVLVQLEGVLPGAPTISFGISGQYGFVLFEGVDSSVGFDYGYIGRSHLGFDESNSPSMGGYPLANLRLGVGLGAWRCILFVDNLTNEQGNTFAFGNPFDFGTREQITPPQPRTIGMSVSWSQ